MEKLLFYLIVGFVFSLNSSAIYNSEVTGSDSINDGPYIFYTNNILNVKWIENSELKEEYIIPNNFNAISKKFNLSCDYKDLRDNYLVKSNFEQSYSNIDSISVISDIHGEYNTYINLLKAMGIIDQNLNWKFGKGHLVVLGDTFDRGNMVTEILWHLFGLEKQAIKAGGMVHLLLGNHEVMVFNKDLGFINDKYVKVETISNINYYDLYSENSVLGRWLLSKPVVITINNIIFVHGGISIEMVQRKLTIKQINQIFSNKIIGKDVGSNFENKELKFLYEDYGPVWYRGYFLDTNFNEGKLDSILDFYGKEHIVVGHTSFSKIIPLFNNKVLGIDAGIMYKQSGEMLLYKNGFFYECSASGKRIKL